MTSILIAGALLHLVLTASLVFGVLHYVQAKVNGMDIIDAFKALGARLVAVVEKLESLAPADFVEKVRSEAAAVASAVESELHPVRAAFEAPIATLEAAVTKIEALVSPPAAVVDPAVEPAPAEPVA